jgi:hypothetical protein
MSQCCHVVPGANDQPSKKNCLIKTSYCFPLSRNVRDRDRCIGTDVDNDIFGFQSVLPNFCVISQSKEIQEKSHTLNRPFLGCSPRPLNNPGGSTRKLPIFSFLPSIVANR